MAHALDTHRRPTPQVSALLRALLNDLGDDVGDTLREWLGAPAGAGEVDGTDPWLTVKEAADYIKAKPQRLYDLKTQGRLIPAGRDGARPLYRQSQLDAYLSGPTRRVKGGR